MVIDTEKASLFQSYYFLVFYVLTYMLNISISGDIYLSFTGIMNLDF